ncbi:MAG: glycosyltransferase [Deltaproteobacteria bacterium]|nr:glycosyltransferase [Deltaproteobacteria bacterium]MBW2361059.1 glycosyltransferase [Deltaproteobacteria bacterium]
MRVLLTASTFPLHRADGTPAFVFGLARALAQRGEVTVLAPGAAGAPSEEVWDGVRIRRFDYFWPRTWQRLAHGDGMETNLSRSWLARLQVPAFLVAQLWATRRLVRELRPDVVNSHWILPQGLTTALARGSRRRFGHAVTLHGGDAHLLATHPAPRRLARFVATRADAFLVSSEAVRETLDAALGRASQALVQPMGVDSGRFRAAAPLDGADEGLRGGYLLYVGRLQEVKGVDVLLQALARLRERHPALGLLVIGYGERERALREQAEQLGLADAVRFAGARCAADVARALRGCRACVVPSRRLPSGREEGMPTVVAEALAAGARLVATRTGGIESAVREGETGWLCRDGDPEALADALARALESSEADAVTQRARAAGEALDWSRVAERYWQAFEGVSAS